jgi:hypothetical protein
MKTRHEITRLRQLVDTYQQTIDDDDTDDASREMYRSLIDLAERQLAKEYENLKREDHRAYLRLIVADDLNR